MNKKQKGVAIAGLIAVVMIGVFPPWTETREYRERIQLQPTKLELQTWTTYAAAGYHRIDWSPVPIGNGLWVAALLTDEQIFGKTSAVPPTSYRVAGYRIDLARLSVQLSVVILAAGGLCLILRSNEPKAHSAPTVCRPMPTDPLPLRSES